MYKILKIKAMYIVRDKKTKKILHNNPAPLVQNLGNKEVYFKFDPKKMEIGKTDGSLPEYFDINEKEEIVELTLPDLVERGFVKLESHQKIVNNKIVDKTVSELLKEGLLKLQPNQKIEKNQIVQKLLKELVDDGVVKLSPGQKVKGNEIVEKSLQEQVKEGIIKLNEPFEYVDGNEIKRYSGKQVIEKKLLKTKKQCDVAISMINGEIEQKIAEKYRPGNEMKITKDYLEWITVSEPANDERVLAYKKMQSDISKIKSEYKDLEKQLSDIKDKLSK